MRWSSAPVELGWAKTLTFDHDFPGAAILEAEARNPVRTICTLEWNDEDVTDVYASLFKEGEIHPFMDMPRRIGPEGQRVMQGDRLVGVTTSRCYSYYARKMISLCVLDAAVNCPGAEVRVLWGPAGPGQKSIRATVAPAPYKKDNRRLDLTRVSSVFTQE